MRREPNHRAQRGLFDVASLANARVGPLPSDPEPAVATQAESVPNGDAWLHETKLDGYRLFARVEGTAVELIGGDHREWYLPSITKALSRLPADAALLDGQLVALQSDGTSSFRQLQDAVARGRMAQLVYEAFDLLYLDDYELTDVDLASRKRALKTLLTGDGALPNRGPVRYVHHFDGNGAELFEEICRLGLPGIVCKLRTSRYRAGPSSDWLDVRCAQRVSIPSRFGERPLADARPVSGVQRPRIVSSLRNRKTVTPAGDPARGGRHTR